MPRDMNRPDSAPGRQSVEDRLRHLSQPMTPPQLRTKIVSTIPTFQPAARPARRVAWRWAAAGLGAAMAAGVLLLVVLLPGYDLRTAGISQPPPPAGSSPKYVIVYQSGNDPKETDPCYILPPSANWH